MTLCFVAFGGLTILVALEPSTSMFDVCVPSSALSFLSTWKPSAVLGICGISRLRRLQSARRLNKKAATSHLASPLWGKLLWRLAPSVLWICSVSAISSFQKQKTEWFCNFFAIADSLLSLQSGNKLLCSRFCCIFGPQFVIRGSEQSLIAKKLQFWSLFCFWFLVCFETMPRRDKPDVAHG